LLAGDAKRRPAGQGRLDDVGEIMRIIGCASILALGAFSTPLPDGAQQTTVPASQSETFTVRLPNFAFDPNHLRLKASVPVRLRLVNVSSGGHDFSAPAFFAASSVPPGWSTPAGGEVKVVADQTVEIMIVPRTPGHCRLECTHFLHSIFGMHGTIEVVP
jgi:uncharacterized cupredoxin-like copper-binding protein